MMPHQEIKVQNLVFSLGARGSSKSPPCLWYFIGPPSAGVSAALGTRTRTNTNPNDTEANAAGRSVRACVARKSKS